MCVCAVVKNTDTIYLFAFAEFNNSQIHIILISPGVLSRAPAGASDLSLGIMLL